ncbi:MAG: hypothetical protein C4326_14595 [Ignavibacteria bacterium]
MSWEEEVTRFYTALNALDDYLASDAVLVRCSEQIFQGPFADVLAHFGQLAMMRRLAGQPVCGENYAVAEIQLGRVGPQQSAQRMEFDRENATGRILMG